MAKTKTYNRKKPYMVLLVLMVTLAISAFVLVDKNEYNPARHDAMHQIDPLSHERLEDGTDVYTFEFLRLTPSNRSLLFYTNHQTVRAYMNHVLIYERTKSDSIFGHTTAAVWNQIALPESAGTVEIMITPVYPNMKQTEWKFFQGNGVEMGYHIIRRSFPTMLMCMAIIIVGICLLCFWTFSRLHKRWPDDVLYLGLLIVFTGFWTLGETQGAIYLVTNRVAASYMAYTCLMAMGILFPMFTHCFMHLHDRIWYCSLMTYGLCTMIGCELLQFLNIRDMRQTVPLIHAMIVGGAAYMLYGICVNLRRHCYVRRTIVNSIGFVVLLVTMALDMYTYYDNRVNANQAGKFGIMIYVSMLCIETIREARRHMNEEQHLQFYRDMAMKDMLTGCYNRNAYDEDLEHLQEARWSQIVTFDLNDLKWCNDTFGHQCGDKYLCDSAVLIRSIYGRYGKVYRIGGDEFCVIAHGLNMKKLGDLRMKLTQAEREYNQRQPQVPIEIACGYAVFDEQQDHTLEDVRVRADAKMYEDKKELKEKSDRTGRIL